jgi:hypothetical protein
MPQKGQKEGQQAKCPSTGSFLFNKGPNEIEGETFPLSFPTAN